MFTALPLSIFIGGVLFILFRAIRSYQDVVNDKEKEAVQRQVRYSISQLIAGVVCITSLLSEINVFSVSDSTLAQSWWQTFSSRIAVWITALLLSLLAGGVTMFVVMKGAEIIERLMPAPMSSEEQAQAAFKNLYFKHPPLSQRKNEFRILHLPKRTGRQDLLSATAFMDIYRRGADSDVYHCTMQNCSLDAPPAFQALSYAWGSGTPTCQIMVNNQPFWITHNLACAIHYLTESRDLTIWIDAICINQKDNKEKSSQVRKMRHIYEQAASVIIWLGKTTMENIGGFRTLKELKMIWDQRTESVTAGSQPIFTELEHEVFVNPTRNATHARVKTELIDAISALLSAPWWGRIWVCQELAVAKSAIFACGYETIPAEYIADFLKAWDTLGGVSRLLDHRPWAHFEVRSRFQSGNPLPIRDILQISSKSQLEATDARDQIFGFGGLAGDLEKKGITVDYSQSHTTVYTNLSKSLIEEQPDLWLLSFCHFSPTSALPSWVPDWSAQPGLISILQAGGAYTTGSPSPFHASRGLQPCIKVSSTTPPSLTCNGIQIDTIVRLGATRPQASYNRLTDAKRNEILTWFRTELPSLLSSISGPESSTAITTTSANTAYKTPSDEAEAIFRTLLADQWEDSSGGNGAWIRPPSRANVAYRTLVSASNSIDDQRRLSTPGVVTEQVFNYAMRLTISRVPLVTTRGFLGLGPPAAEVGDLVVVLGGGDVPFVLRSVGVRGDGARERFKLIGEAYVHGVMYGEGAAMGNDTRAYEIV
jgi:hypothetical protein